MSGLAQIFSRNVLACRYSEATNEKLCLSANSRQSASGVTTSQAKLIDIPYYVPNDRDITAVE